MNDAVSDVDLLMHRGAPPQCGAVLVLMVFCFGCVPSWALFRFVLYEALVLIAHFCTVPRLYTETPEPPGWPPCWPERVDEAKQKQKKQPKSRKA